MSELFKTALSLSLSGSVLILAVVLICRPLRGRLSRRWQYYIWLVVAARLLLPLTPAASPAGLLFGGRGETAASGGSAMAAVTDTEIESPSIEGKTTSPAEEEAPDPSNPAAAQALPQTRARALPPLIGRIAEWLWLPWLLVALVLLIRKITLYQSFAKYVRAGQTDVTDEALLIEFGALCEEAGVRRTIELRINPLVASPLLLGILRLCVVLPNIPASQSARRYILLHELTHYRRGDIFYKWLLQLTLCLHWFNPLVHWMLREAGRACELSCDEAVIRALPPREQRAYGNTLLASLETPGSYRESLAAVTLHENAVLLKERLENIMNYKKTIRLRRITSAALCLALFLGGFALGAYLPDTRVAAASTADNGGEMTATGLPIMSAANREIYSAYLEPVSVTTLLSRNFSPEDISELIEHGPSLLLAVMEALEQETFAVNDYYGAVPADWADEVITSYLPIRSDKVRAVCADIYDEAADCYLYDGGLGGGTAVPIVTGSELAGDLMTIRYTWYINDESVDSFYYVAQDSGELVVELGGDGHRYLSNRVIAANPIADSSGEPDIVDEALLAVLEDCLTRGGEAIQLLHYEFPTRNELAVDGFAPLDYDYELPDEAAQDEIWLDILQVMGKLYSVADVERLVAAAFDEHTSSQLLGRMLEGQHPMYRDIDGAIHRNIGVSPGPVLTFTWDLDSVEPLRREDERIVVQMRAQSFSDRRNDEWELQVLTLVREDGIWKLTESFFEANYFQTIPD